MSIDERCGRAKDLKPENLLLNEKGHLKAGAKTSGTHLLSMARDMKEREGS